MRRSRPIAGAFGTLVFVWLMRRRVGIEERALGIRSKIRPECQTYRRPAAPAIQPYPTGSCVIDALAVMGLLFAACLVVGSGSRFDLIGNRIVITRPVTPLVFAVGPARPALVVPSSILPRSDRHSFS